MPVTIRTCWSAAGKTGGQTDETWSWQQIKAKKKISKKDETEKYLRDNDDDLHTTGWGQPKFSRLPKGVMARR